MKLAHIVPTSCLKYLPDEQTAHLALSNLVVRNLEYAQFHIEKAALGDTVILDNPVHEFVTPNLEDWLQAIKMIQPRVAVLPDKIESSITTVQWAYDAMQKNDTPVEYMGVAHGDNDDDFFQCAAELAHLGVKWIGISLERRLNNDAAAYLTRLRRLQMLAEDSLFNGVNFHFLGISEAGMEFISPETQRIVTSADTSEFAVWWLSGRPIEPVAPIPYPYPGREVLGGSLEYFDYVPEYESKTMRHMTSNLKRWIRFAEER